MRTDAASLRVSGLHAGYGAASVLHGVALEVAHGEVVTLIGANGAGKSSLMKVIAGLLEARQGAVSLHGEEITGLWPDQRVQRGLALVPEGRRLFATMT